MKKYIFLLLLISILFNFTGKIFAENKEFVFEGYAKRSGCLSNPYNPVQGAEINCTVEIINDMAEYYEYRNTTVYTNSSGYYYVLITIDVPTDGWEWPDDFEITQDCGALPNANFEVITHDFVTEILGYIRYDAYGFEPAEDDTDDNEIPDELELELAQKFAPQFYCHREQDSTDISPEPFKIMGGAYNTDVHITVYNYLGQVIDGLENVSCTNCRVEFYDPYEAKWDTILSWAGTEHDYHESFQGDQYPFNNQWSLWRVWNSAHTTVEESGNFSLSNTYYREYNFSWPGSSASEWESNYDPYRFENTTYKHTIYATLFKEGCQYAIQYWFFYPFNDWVNDHEGDIEHINVAITGLDSNVADIDFVDYYFHKKVKRCSKALLSDFSSIVDNTHPKVFIGGYGYAANLGSGPNSGGSYPWAGHWDDVAVYLIVQIDENVDGLGDVTQYTAFSQDDSLNNRRGLELLKDPEYEDYVSFPWLSWNATKIAVGVPRYGEFGVAGVDTYIYSPYYSGGWRQLGACGGWSNYNP